jgi:DNA-directed RNA polymerase subunit RPC12/RpoP
MFGDYIQILLSVQFQPYLIRGTALQAFGRGLFDRFKASRSDQVQPAEKWVKGLTCPRCGARTEPNGKSFAFGVFEGRGYSCVECGKRFSAYYRDEVFNHTVPKADVEVFELEGEQADPAPEEEPVIEEEKAEEMPPPPEALEVEETLVIEDKTEEIPPAPIEVPEIEKSAETEENVPPRESVISDPPAVILESLRKLRDDTIQVNELRDEEDRIVDALLEAFLEVMSSIPGGLPVNPELLPGEASDVDRLSVSSSGELLMLYLNGEMDAVELSDPENRDLLVDVINDVFPKVRHQIVEMKGRLEKRIVYLSTVTEELRGMAASIAEVKGRI